LKIGAALAVIPVLSLVLSRARNHVLSLAQSLALDLASQDVLLHPNLATIGASLPMRVIMIQDVIKKFKLNEME